MSNESVDILIQRSEVLRSRNINQAFALLNDAFSIAKKSGYKRGIARVHFHLGLCHLSQNNYKKSLTDFNDALQLFEAIGENESVIACYNEISAIYLKLGDYPSSLDCAFKALRIHTENNNEYGIASSHNEVGNIYICLKEHEKAIEHFKRALKIYETKRNKKEMINSFFLLGSVYNLLNDYDKAQYYLSRSINSIDALDDMDRKVKTLNSIAVLYTKLKEYDKALNYFHEALDLANLGANTNVKTQIKKDLGNLYINLTQYDKAIEILNKALRVARFSPMEIQLVNIHQYLSIAYEKLGEFEKALYHFRKFYELDKQITSEDVNLKAKGLQIKFDLEELRKEKEIAELSDKLKEQFLANVSHEIRTPMNGVLGMTHLLEQTTLSKDQHEYIEAIKLSAQNLMGIINDILDFSKINAGKIEFTEAEFNLRELIKGITQILRVKAEEKSIQLNCVFDYHIKDVLIGDPFRLNQILINLIGNAVKFTEKGKVVLEIKVLETNNDKCKLRFRISDSGIGIPQDKINSIFESFEQVDNSKKRYEGTGLGLTIVKKLVELQGGTVSVTSIVNEGSEFTFDLSFKIAEQQNQYSVKLTPVSVGKKDFSAFHILIVEDNKVNQLLVRNMLKNFGFTEFDCAENGKVALEKLLQNNYDLILMDIQMPEMNGYEITREIRTNMSAANRVIPIIALTADASEKEKTKAREAGMNDYVVKPYTPEELYTAITSHINLSDENIQNSESFIDEEPNENFSIESLKKYVGGDIELAVQLIEIFLHQVPEAIEKFEKLIPVGDWKHVHGVAHKLKGSISIFELGELKRILISIEEHARDCEHLSEIPALFNQFKTMSRSVVSNLEIQLQKLKRVKA